MLVLTGPTRGRLAMVDHDLLPMLRPLLSDPEERMRAALVEVLGQRTDWGPRHPAVAEFAVDESWHVRWALLQSLRRRNRRTEDAVAAGIEALRAELAH